MREKYRGEEKEHSLLGSLSQEIIHTEIVDYHDRQVTEWNVPHCQKREMSGIFRQKSFQAVHINNASENANVPDGRFALALKISRTPNEKPRARYVVQGHKDVKKSFVAHILPNMLQRYILVFEFLPAVKGFVIFSDVVSQAYLQNDVKLSREV